MRNYIIKRILLSILILFCVTFVLYVLMRSLPASFVESNITSTLESAGINQTQHKILMDFTVKMSAIIPGYTTSVEVNTQVSIADTLIIGAVPEFYAAALEGKT